MIRLTEQYQKIGDFEFALTHSIVQKSAPRFEDASIEVEQLNNGMYRIWVNHPTEKYTYMREGGSYSPKDSYTAVTLDNSDSLDVEAHHTHFHTFYQHISFKVKDNGHLLNFCLIPEKWGDYVIMLVDVLK